MSLGRFICLWTHPDYSPGPVTIEELRFVEARLRTRLPADYCRAVVEFGLPRPTLELLSAIVDRELNLRDVSEFLDPAEIVTTTEDWRDLGLPEELVAFATDSMGNLFCFPTDAEARPSAPVFLYDHDSGDIELMARSFDEWIEGFCGIETH
jgi:SMI1-KNR4 cell-wall